MGKPPGRPAHHHVSDRREPRVAVRGGENELLRAALGVHVEVDPSEQTPHPRLVPQRVRSEVAQHPSEPGGSAAREAEDPDQPPWREAKPPPPPYRGPERSPKHVAKLSPPIGPT